MVAGSTTGHSAWGANASACCTCENPVFLQNLPMPHLGSESGKLDIVALDIIRDRERGVPRFNEFRRQIGLKTLTSFDDFVDVRLDENDPWRKHQEETVRLAARGLWHPHMRSKQDHFGRSA